MAHIGSIAKNIVRASKSQMLLSQRNQFLLQLKSQLDFINQSLICQVRIYRLACLHPRWAESIVPFLDQHTHLKCWELTYWRFRSNLVYSLTNSKISEQFVEQINEHNYLDSDVVLLSGLLEYPEQLHKYKGILENILMVIAEQMHLLTVSDFIRVVDNLKKAAPNYPAEISAAVQDYVNKNISKFEINDCGPLLFLTDTIGFKPKDSLLTNDPKVIHWRCIYALYSVNKLLQEHNFSNQMFLHNNLPEQIFEKIRFIITKKENHDTSNIYNFFEDIPQKNTEQLKANSLKQIAILSSCMIYLKQTSGRVELLRQANRIIKSDTDIANLLDIMYFSEKNNVQVDLKIHENIKEVLETYLQNLSEAMLRNQTSVSFLRLVFIILRICSYSPEFKKYLPKLDLPYLCRFQSKDIRFEIIKAITIHRDFCAALPKLASYYLQQMRSENSKVTRDIMYKQKLELYTNNRKTLQFVTSKREYRSDSSLPEKTILTILKQEFPDIKWMIKYILHGYEIDFLLSYNGKQLYLDINGPSHFYQNSPTSLNPACISKTNLLSEICNYEKIDLSKTSRQTHIQTSLRSVLVKHFGVIEGIKRKGWGGKKVENKILDKPANQPNKK